MANKEDHSTYAEALYGPDSCDFVGAMETKILTLIELDVFELVKRESNMNVISGVWTLCRIQYPDGFIRKVKARYCACGFKQIEGYDYFKTHSPVVMWMLVRLLLVMSILLNLETSQIDYTATFVHKPIDYLVYVEAPVGFQTQIGDIDYVWKLNKPLYGLCQSPKKYCLYKKVKLESMGFVQSIADPCVFMSAEVICLIYVDDALLFYKSPQAMESLKQKMRKDDMLFCDKDSVACYLGVHMDRREDGTIHLTQSGCIVEAMHLNDKTVYYVDIPCTKFLPLDEFDFPTDK